jgi:predicted nucleic acid-binding protein
VRPVRLLPSLTELAATLVAETSTAINLIATGFAASIIRDLPVRVVAVDAVQAELEMERGRGRTDAERFNELVAEGLVQIVGPGDAGNQHFEELVIGSAAESLDDGEAATIAYGVEQQGTACIDERKATRICSVRFPSLRIGCTVDILTHSQAQEHLGAERFSDALFNAPHDGRMRVFRTIWKRSFD